jgi:putative ABC transport system permease protein
MNLSTARSEKRAKEVGIRKVAGANKQVIIGQFLGESILITGISGIFALLLIQGFLLPFDNLVNKELVIPYNSVYFWVAAIGFILITGIIAGSYPAFFMSSFKPVSILKGTFKRIHAGINLRKVLVISQFGFAIVLIVSTWIVMQQIRYVQERETGFVRDQLVYHWITGELSKSYPLIKNELVRSGSVKFLVKTSAPLIDNFNDTWSIQWAGKDPNAKIDFDRFNEDEGLVKTAGLQLIQGRDMDLVNFPSDSSAVLLNESAVHAMGFTQPIGQLIKDQRFEYHVVGVIRDFVMGSPNENIRPEIILGAKGNDIFNVINMRLNPNRPAAENLQIIEKIFKKYNPDYPIELHFVDLDYAKKFDDMQKTAVFSGLFTGLTILISCLGLFGLSAFMAESRIKEIGVRKVLGASVSGIVRLLSKDFLTLILISVIIACPIAWFVMHHWLQAYSYRIQIDWWIFLLSGLAAMLIAGITVSFQAIKAALGNPVKAIRSE